MASSTPTPSERPETSLLRPHRRTEPASPSAPLVAWRLPFSVPEERRPSVSRSGGLPDLSRNGGSMSSPVFPTPSAPDLGSAPSAARAGWVDAIADAETEEQILSLALAGAAETTGAARGFLLRPETHLSEPGLVGALAVESQGTPDAVALWSEVARTGGMDAMAPELTSRVRTVRLPFRGR